MMKGLLYTVQSTFTDITSLYSFNNSWGQLGQILFYLHFMENRLIELPEAVQHRYDVKPGPSES